MDTSPAIDRQVEANETRHRWLRRGFGVLAVTVFTVAVVVLSRELRDFRFDDFRRYVGDLTAPRLAFAIGATVAGYGALICYDVFALRFVRQKLAFRRIAMTAFIGYAFSLNIGQSVLSGGAVRMRLYTGWGVSVGDVARVLGFNLMIGFLGEMLACGTLFSLVEIPIPRSAEIPIRSVRWLGIVFLVLLALAFVLIASGKMRFRWKGRSIELPPPGLAAPAAVVSAIDWLLAGTVLFALMPPGTEVPLLPFLGVVLLSRVVALISLVPGGLGVLESMVVLLLPDSVPSSMAISALIAYRAIYYLAPLAIAICLLAGHEFSVHRWGLPAVLDWVRGRLSR